MYDCNDWYRVWCFSIWMIFMQMNTSTWNIIDCWQCWIKLFMTSQVTMMMNSILRFDFFINAINSSRFKFIKYVCHSILFNHELILLISSFWNTCCFFSLIMLMIWFISFLIKFHSDVWSFSFSLCTTSISLFTSTYYDSCFWTKNRWHTMIFHDFNASFLHCLIWSLLLEHSHCICCFQSCFCLQWVCMNLTLQHMYQQLSDFNWHIKSFMQIFNFKTALLT